MCDKYVETPNEGLDVGAFLRVLDKIREYDYVIKVHAKNSKRNGVGWRKELYRVAFSPEALELLADPTIGMVGPETWVCYEHYRNRALIKEWHEKLFGCSMVGEEPFIAGTMFAAKTSVFDCLTPELTTELLAKMHPGYIRDDVTGQIPHALERLFGYMVSQKGLKIAGL